MSDDERELQRVLEFCIKAAGYTEGPTAIAEIRRRVGAHARLVALLRHARRLIESAVANAKIAKRKDAVIDLDAAEEFLAAVGETLPPEGGPVRPIHEYCQAFETWAGALRASMARGEGDPQKSRLVDSIADVELAVRKSNLLYRLLYLGQPLRTVPCPLHKGHWSGCYPDPCPHGCSQGSDITGWLPEADTPT